MHKKQANREDFGVKNIQNNYLVGAWQILLNWPNKLLFLTVGVVSAGLFSVPVSAAERVYVSYSILERSISVDALETYAKEGRIEDDELAVYAQYADPKQLTELRDILLARAEISPVAISQFLYTRQGEVLLERLGEVIQSDSGLSGSLGIRAALIKAAADPGGLTLLNVLHHFPTRSIRIDLRRAVQIALELSRLIDQSNRAIALVDQLSEAEAATNPSVATLQFQNLEFEGLFDWEVRGISLNDRLRNREFVADIYLPVLSSARIQPPSTPPPLIVISHGLGSDRTTYQYLAEHLASHGFAVAVPEHPGSNSEQFQNLITGRASEVSQELEFINRPLDVKYLLDELNALVQNNPNFQGRLNPQQVGVIGQSFGGYTVLALAGAQINFEKLQQTCQYEEETWNVSLLLQCRALLLPIGEYNFRDERVKAAIAVNPITSSIFGEAGMSQISVPLVLMAGGADTVTPAWPEQIQSFTWLTTLEKYLVLMRGGTHFSTLSGDGSIELPAFFDGPDPALARRYLNGVSVAFFASYLANRSQYEQYLEANFIEAIAEDPLGLSLIRSLTTPELLEALDGVIPEPTPNTETENLTRRRYKFERLR